MIRALILTVAMTLAFPAASAVQPVEVTSPGGIKAWLLQDETIPFAALEIFFIGGTSLDPTGKRGAVRLMTNLLEQGAGDLNAQDFAAARDDLAAQFGFASSADGISVSATFLSENRESALDLFALALNKPRFDYDAIERARAQILASQAASAKDPEAIAFNAAAATIYGEHPYGSDDNGTAQSVGALTREDIQSAYRAALALDRLVIAAAGDISAAELGAALDKLLGTLPKQGASLPPRAQPNYVAGVSIKDFPGPQSSIHFTQPGLNIKDPDFLAAMAVNEILGGGRFSARLMREIRDKRGLTYGVNTALASMKFAETMVGSLQVSNDKVSEAIDVLRAEWAKLASGDITQAELDAAKKYMIGSYPMRWDGNEIIAAILVEMQNDGISIDYPKTRNDRVRALTLDEVNRVARRLMRPDQLQITIVGQPNPTPK